VVVIPRARGKVVIEVSRELRDRIRELSQKYGVLYEDLLRESLDLYTQSNTQSKGWQQDITKAPVHVKREDYMRWTIKVGEGFNTIEISLNNMQLEKLCRARLLARVVCKEAGFI
jgi:phosphosulfolactate synthase (CoM biosynthesis protein A)